MGGRAPTSDETEIVEAVMAYLRDRLEFEPVGLSGGAGRGCYDETLRRHEAFQRRHRTKAAAERIGIVTIGDPLTVDPDRTTVVVVKVRGTKATVEVRRASPSQHRVHRRATSRCRRSNT